MIDIDQTTWAWVLVGLAAVNVVLLAGTALVLALVHVRRHRPLVLLADAVARHDVEQARYHLARIGGRPGQLMDVALRRSLENGSPKMIRDRFIRGYLTGYPAASALLKLWTVVVCGTAAVLPYLVSCAGRAALATAALEQDRTIPIDALTLNQLGLVETVVAGAVAWALVLVAFRDDPGAGVVKRRILARLTESATRR